MKILRTTDIITLRQNDIEVDFSPLRHDKALELSRLVTIRAGKTVADDGMQTALLVKYAVKEVRGLKNFIGEDFSVVAVNGEQLTDDDVTTVINVLLKTSFLPAVAYISSSATPKQFEGVEMYMKNSKGEPVKIELGN